MSLNEKKAEPIITRRSFLEKATKVGLGVVGATVFGFEKAKAEGSDNVVVREPLSPEKQEQAEKLRQELNDTHEIFIDNIDNDQFALEPLLDTIFSLMGKVGVFGKELKDKNAGGIIAIGSAFDDILEKYDAEFRSKIWKEKEMEETIERAVADLLEDTAEQFPGSDLEKQRKYINKYMRGFICGYYEYCGPIY